MDILDLPLRVQEANVGRRNVTWQQDDGRIGRATGEVFQEPHHEQGFMSGRIAACTLDLGLFNIADLLHLQKNILHL